MASLLNMSGGSLLNKGLPYDAEIEYLQGDGKAHIRTPFTINDIDYRIVNFSIKFARTTDALEIFAGTTYQYLQFPIVNKRLRLDWARGTVVGASTNILNINEPYIVEQINGYVRCDGLSVQISHTLSSTYSFYLFTKLPQYGSYNTRIYYFEGRDITTNNQLFYFIPVRIGNVGYMYDKVSGQLFGNSGTGDFILGPDK